MLRTGHPFVFEIFRIFSSFYGMIFSWKMTANKKKPMLFIALGVGLSWMMDFLSVPNVVFL